MISNNRPELLILNRTQFGYHLDTYYYCKCAANRLRIKYVGFDTGRPRLDLEGVEVTYVAYGGRMLRRYLRLLAAFAREVRRSRGTVFINYFPGCGLLRCMGARRRMIVDVRTGSVHGNTLVRRVADWLMRWECRLFRNISVVSTSLAERLHLPPYKTHVLPLGAESTPPTQKRFDHLDLLYVGTLYGRRIEDTVIGVEQFLRGCDGPVSLAYTIVGDGHDGQLEELRRVVRRYGLEGIVHVLGYVHKTQLRAVFDRCNVGVSYVPINDIYNCQPVTKTFEYLFAGMPVIATATVENRRVVDRLNGVLIQDTPEEFCRGLREVYDRRYRFDCEALRLCHPESSWDRIVGHNFVPYIRRVCQPPVR